MGLQQWWNDVVGGAETIADLVTGRESGTTMLVGAAITLGVVSEQQAVDAMPIIQKEGIPGAMAARDARDSVVSQYGAPAQDFFDFVSRNPQAVRALDKLGGEKVSSGSTAEQIRKIGEYAASHGGTKAFEDIMAVLAQKDDAGKYQLRPGFTKFVAVISEHPELASQFGGTDAGVMPDIAAMRELTKAPDFYTDAATAIETHVGMTKRFGAQYEFLAGALGQNPELMKSMSVLAGGDGGAGGLGTAMQSMQKMAEQDPAMFNSLNRILFTEATEGQPGAFTVAAQGTTYCAMLRPGAQEFLNSMASNPEFKALMAGGPGGGAQSTELLTFLAAEATKVPGDNNFFQYLNQAMDKFAPGGKGPAQQLSMSDMKALVSGAASDGRLRASPQQGEAYTALVTKLEGDPALKQSLSALFGGQGGGDSPVGQARVASMLEKMVKKDPKALTKLSAVLADPGFKDLLGEIAGNDKLAGLMKGIGGLDAQTGGDMPAAVVDKLYELSTKRKGFFKDAATMLRDNKGLISSMAGTVSGVMGSDPVKGLDKLASFVDGNNMVSNVFNMVGGIFGKDFADGLRKFVQPFLEMLAPLIGKLTGFGPALDKAPQLAGTGDMTRDATKAAGLDPAHVQVETESGPRAIAQAAPEQTTAPVPENQKRVFPTASLA